MERRVVVFIVLLLRWAKCIPRAEVHSAYSNGTRSRRLGARRRRVMSLQGKGKSGGIYELNHHQNSVHCMRNKSRRSYKCPYVQSRSGSALLRRDG